MPSGLKVKQFRYSHDNFGYLIYGNRMAMAVDGGAVSEIVAFTTAKKLTLAHVAHTHSHVDHTTGSKELMNRTGATFLSQNRLLKDGAVSLEKKTIRVLSTPGHTRDSLVFSLDGYLITGDTLFNGTVGNCFSGDLRAFYRSIVQLLSFPDETVICAGHDYVEASMQFARALEPENRAIEAYLERYDPAHVFSTLADEKRVNPYLRFNAPEMIAVLEKRGLPAGSAYQRWKSLMSLE